MRKFYIFVFTSWSIRFKLKLPAIWKAFLETFILAKVLFKKVSKGSILWWPITAIEEKLSKSRKKFHNRGKAFRIKKKILESRKIFRNRETNFRMEKNVSESRKLFQNRDKMFQNREIFCYKNREKSLELNVFNNILA